MIPTQRPPSLITGTPGRSFARSTLSTDSTGSVGVHRGNVGLHDVADGQRHGAQLTGSSAHKLRAMTDFWAGRRVLVTGHTGFKGGWLALWLQRARRGA